MSVMPTVREINVLPASVVNKIAAGEVIERPASVVKELMENSVDAGATSVDVTIEKGGIDRICITDDGCGMRPDQLQLAVTSHATSKIHDADDLFEVQTLGFRGEALASIAEISHFTIRSRTHDCDAGAEMEIVGGKANPISPCGTPPGTTIEVRNLFFNTPVRRRYLRTPQTESGHIGEAFTRIALAYPEVRFRLTHNGKTLHDLPPVDNWKMRIGHFFGRDLRDAMIAVESENEDVRVSGYVVDPTHSRAHNRMQYLFLNGRAIRDRSLQHALGEAYRGLLLTGRFPIAFLRLEMPPAMVDVNVHPCKLEVRWQEGGRLYSQLLGTIRDKFLGTDLTARVGNHANEEPDRPAAGGFNQAGQTHSNSPSDGRTGSASSGRGYLQNLTQNDADFRAHREQIQAWARGQLGEGENQTGATENESIPREQRQMDLSSGHPSPALPSPWDIVRYPESTDADASQDNESGQPMGAASESEQDQRRYVSAIGGAESQTRPVGLQIQNRYLVAETEEGMTIIDQHALHERILYEEIRAKVLSGKMEIQRLLVPEPVELSSAEVAVVMDSTELIEQLGMEVKPFGGSTILVTGIPVMLSKFPPAELLRKVIEGLMVDGKKVERRDLIDEVLHMMSCKAAIKAGDRLSQPEITALLERRELCQDAHHCPHGRPTALIFSREELDKRFKRI